MILKIVFQHYLVAVYIISPYFLSNYIEIENSWNKMMILENLFISIFWNHLGLRTKYVQEIAHFCFRIRNVE